MKILKQISDRKLRLIALACCKNSVSVWHRDQQTDNCLIKFELFLDGKCSFEEFQLARQIVVATPNTLFYSTTCYTCCTSYDAARTAIRGSNLGTEIVKDIYNPNLLTLKFSKQAVSLAEQVYDGDNDAKGILSDYLEESNYPEELYLHLKQPTHYKGCWVIDQILGKS